MLCVISEVLVLLGEAEGSGRESLLLHMIEVIGASVDVLPLELLTEYYNEIELLTYERISTLRWASNQVQSHS